MSQSLSLEGERMLIALGMSKLFLVPCLLGEDQPEAGGCYCAAISQGDASPFIT